MQALSRCSLAARNGNLVVTGGGLKLVVNDARRIGSGDEEIQSYHKI